MIGTSTIKRMKRDIQHAKSIFLVEESDLGIDYTLHSYHFSIQSAEVAAQRQKQRGEKLNDAYVRIRKVEVQ